MSDAFSERRLRFPLFLFIYLFQMRVVLLSRTIPGRSSGLLTFSPLFPATTIHPPQIGHPKAFFHSLNILTEPAKDWWPNDPASGFPTLRNCSRRIGAVIYGAVGRKNITSSATDQLQVRVTPIKPEKITQILGDLINI